MATATAVHTGGICCLEEVLEACKDIPVGIHSVADERRLLSMQKVSELR